MYSVMLLKSICMHYISCCGMQTSLLCSEEINLTRVLTSGCDAICLVVGCVGYNVYPTH